MTVKSLPALRKRVSFQYTEVSWYTLKASLNGVYATSGSRKGAVAGLSIYMTRGPALRLISNEPVYSGRVVE